MARVERTELRLGADLDRWPDGHLEEELVLGEPAVGLDGLARFDGRLQLAAAKFREFMQALELDLDDPNLAGTPLRVARAYRELFAGVDPGAEPKLRTFPNTEHYAEPVLLTGIPFYSICAHHFLPFFGTAQVAYLPEEHLVGLSKLARLVEFYARRPQLQERLTAQIAAALERRLRPRGVLVAVQARHLCMEMRGVGKPGVLTTTRAIRGAFEDEGQRRKLLELLPPRGRRALQRATRKDA